MSGKGRFYLGLVAIALMVGGGQGIYTAVTNAEPATYTVEDYLRDRPDSTWLHLTDTTLDLTQASYTEIRFIRRISELYIPVFSADYEPNAPIQIIVLTKNAEMLQTLKDLQSVSSQGEGAIAAYLKDHRDQIFISTEVSGLVQIGIDTDTDTRQKLQQLYGSRLSSDFILLKADAKPNLWLSGVLVVLGVGLAGVVLLPMIKGQQRT
jgi:hypothetical protein